jgi:eukaryotic-like serine/threonine-protein kinase
MKPERWKEVERLYHSALILEPGQRASFLAQACTGNESLRAEVESLLSQSKKAKRFLETPAIEVVARKLGEETALPEEEQPVGRLQPLEDANKKLRRRAPWWMYAVAAAFLICAAVHWYAVYVAPTSPGTLLQTPIDWNRAVIKTVLPDYPAAEAGVEPGDIILNLREWMSRAPYWESGHAYRLEIERKGERKILFLTLRQNRLINYYQWVLKGFIPVLLVSPLCLILALFIGFSRPYDPAARWGALFYAVVAVDLMDQPLGWLSALLRFPIVIIWLTLLVQSFCVSSYISIGITLFGVFPRRLFRQFHAWALVWLPAAMLMPALFLSDHPPAYSFPKWWPNWYETLLRVLVFPGALAIVMVIVWNYLRLHDLNQRRRFRIMVAGAAITLVAALPYVAFNLFGDPVLIVLLKIPVSLLFAVSCLTLAGPISGAYAILRHRLFDIGVMIRLGLQYAIARGALLSLIPIVGVLLAGDLLLHRREPLGDILSQRGLLYAVLAGGACLLHTRRRVWLDALDRRFFRERYDAQRVLRTVVDEIREARSFEKVAPRVVSQIEAALHPQFAALIVRRPEGEEYRVLAAQGKAPPPILATSKLIGLVRLLGKPVEILQSQTGWLMSQLPLKESEFLRQIHIEWLFPICLAEGQTEALLAMGPKRSEEPYSREDQDLLQGITSSLALLLEQSPSPAQTSEGFEECPKCGSCYDSGSGSCKKEGAKLISLPFARLVARRYRFEQRLGEGGMGIVYQARDMELERQVAVKLIRSDLTASPETVTRFKREAKAAASFTHPNVVTVHDFGVEENQRAFLVMELLRGLTLRQELNKTGRLDAPRALEILHGVCTAVDAAHQQRLLHRDLKPENIFLAKSGETETAKILDFGVAKPIASAERTLSTGQTGPGMLVGTLEYMSPEQLRGEKPAESWDLWALAVVAYEMLAGVHPFAGSTMLDVYNAILAGCVIPLCTHLPEAPQTWQRFFDEALSTRIESRPDSALRLFSTFRQSILTA